MSREPASRRQWMSGPRVTLIRMLPAVSVPLTVVAALSVIVGAVLPTVFIVASGVMAGRVPPAVRTGLDSPEGRSLLGALALVAILYVAQLALLPLLNIGVNALTRRVDRHLSNRVMRAVGAPLTIAHLEDPNVLDDVAKAEGIVTGFTPGGAVLGIASLWTMRLQGVGSLLIVATFRWWLAALLLAEAVWQQRYWRRRFDDFTASVFDRGQIHRRSGYFRDAVLTPEAAKEVRAFGLERWIGSQFHDAWTNAMRPVFRDMRGDWKQPASVLLTAAAAVLGFGVVAQAGLTGAIGVGAAVVYLGAVRGSHALAAVSDWDHVISEGVAALPVALDIENRFAGKGSERGVPAAGLPQRSITFDAVEFAYPGRDQKVFDGLDLEIEAGTSLAIVGDNGAGKTTLVKLLASLHRPSGGRILVDGIPLDELDGPGWQRRVAAIFQDFERYELSARHNVGYGCPELVEDDDALRRAVVKAGAEPIVDRLEKGWDTPLSRQLAGGVDLSGGEWQRIALARAMVAVEGGAGVLVLDEPTANLDVRAEAEIYDRFLELTRGLTTIVISHRFSTVRRAQRIVVIENGRVIEDGSHEDLVRRGGRYAHLFTLQASRYVDGGTLEEPVGG